MWVSNFLKSYVNPNLGVCVSVGRGEGNLFRYWAKLIRLVINNFFIFNHN